MASHVVLQPSVSVLTRPMDTWPQGAELVTVTLGERRVLAVTKPQAVASAALALRDTAVTNANEVTATATQYV